MNILALRTDKPEAELYLYSNFKCLSFIRWPAHLKLAETIHTKIDVLLKKAKFEYADIDAVAIYKGPGSFTGLRIGISVANAIAFAQAIPIVAKSGDDWIKKSITGLQAGQNDKIAVPEYGAPVRITTPKK